MKSYLNRNNPKLAVKGQKTYLVIPGSVYFRLHENPKFVHITPDRFLGSYNLTFSKWRRNTGRELRRAGTNGSAMMVEITDLVRHPDLRQVTRPVPFMWDKDSITVFLTGAMYERGWRVSTPPMEKAA